MNALFIKIGILAVLVVVSGFLIFFGKYFGFPFNPIIFFALWNIFTISCVYLFLIPVKIFIRRIKGEKFVRDYQIIIKCKKCGAEYHKTDCPIYCDKCDEFLTPGIMYITVGLGAIIFAAWFTFFLLTNISRTQNLNLALGAMGFFVLFGINFILYGTGKKKMHLFSFGLIFFFIGLSGVFFLLSNKYPEVRNMALFMIAFSIVGLLILILYVIQNFSPKNKFFTFLQNILGAVVIAGFLGLFMFVFSTGKPDPGFLLFSFMVIPILIAIYINPKDILNALIKKQGRGELTVGDQGAIYWRRTAAFMILILLTGVFIYIKRFGLTFF